MKQQVSPIMATIIVLAVIGVAAFAWIQFTGGGAGSKDGTQPPGMPAGAAAEIQKAMGGSAVGTAPKPNQGGLGGMSTPMPGGGGGMSAPMPGGGGMSAPPMAGR